MSEKSKNWSKEQTTHQMSARSNRNFMAGRIVSIMRSNSGLSAQELVNIESALRDDMHNNPWLLTLCKSIAEESVFLTKEELELYSQRKDSDQDNFIHQSKIDDLNKELNFLRERTDILNYIHKEITEKLKNIRKNGFIFKSEDNSSDKWLQMKIKAKESLEVLKNELKTDLCVDEPQKVVDCVVTKVNDILTAIDSNQSSDDLLDRLLDEMALTEDNKLEVIEIINSQFYQRLDEIHNCLKDLLNECLQIKDYYELNVSEEMSWRTDIASLISHLRDLATDSHFISLPQSDKNTFVTKRRLITEYSKIFSKVEKQEFDEIQTLVEQLKQRIEILSDKS